MLNIFLRRIQYLFVLSGLPLASVYCFDENRGVINYRENNYERNEKSISSTTESAACTYIVSISENRLIVSL